MDARRKPMRRHKMVVRSFLTSDRRYIRLTKLGGRFDQRVEHGFEIEGRAADDLEHVSSGGLLLQGLAQLVEQTGVFDGDDGLGGKIADQLDLLVGERSDLLAVDGDRAYQLVLLEHRDHKQGPNTSEFHSLDGV